VATSAADDFKLRPHQLPAKARGCALVMGYPNNPTGAVMERADLLELAQAVQERDLLVISDEIYAELTYNGPHVSFASLPGMKERTILLGGFSKAFAMTGWRLGFAAAAAPFIEAMSRINSYTVMCAPTTAQEAAVEALRAGEGEAERMREQYDQRRRLVLARLRALGLECFEPKGAFYAFPSISAAGLSSEAFAEQLLAEEQVAVIPGPAFGPSGEGYVRCSYATSFAKLEEALARMARFVERHKIERS
jgi:aminotransferase